MSDNYPGGQNANDTTPGDNVDSDAQIGQDFAENADANADVNTAGTSAANAEDSADANTETNIEHSTDANTDANERWAPESHGASAYAEAIDTSDVETSNLDTAHFDTPADDTAAPAPVEAPRFSDLDDLEQTVPMTPEERLEAESHRAAAESRAQADADTARFPAGQPIDYSFGADAGDTADDSADEYVETGAEASEVIGAPTQSAPAALVEPPTTATPTLDATTAATAAAASAAATSAALRAEPRPVPTENPYVLATPQASAELALVEKTAVLETAHTSMTEPVLATGDPADAAFARPPQRVVYVDAPEKPKKKNNRGIGALIAVLGAVLYAVLFALLIFGVFYATLGRAVTNFVVQQSFFVPVVLFLVGFVVLVLIANRAGWWAHVLGSLFVGVFVYLGTIGILLLLDNLVQMTPTQATAEFNRALLNPLVIASGLLAREVALWVGLAISARGRRVKTRNQKALDDFNKDAAERRAEYDRSAAAATPAY